jgi:hypothetical protein
MGSKAGQVQETGAQRAQADHAMNLLQDYQQRWLPVQQKLASTIEQEGAKGSSARQLAAGKASNDVAMNFDKAGGAVEKSLANAGVEPGSSRSNLAITGMGSDEAGSKGLNHLMSDQSIDDAYTQGLGALTALGRGERAQVGQNMSTEAAASAAQASADAQASLATHEGNAALIGQVGGFGLQQGMKGWNTPAASGTGIAGHSSGDVQGLFSNNGYGSTTPNPSGINTGPN